MNNNFKRNSINEKYISRVQKPPLVHFTSNIYPNNLKPEAPISLYSIQLPLITYGCDDGPAVDEAIDKVERLLTRKPT